MRCNIRIDSGEGPVFEILNAKSTFSNNLELDNKTEMIMHNQKGGELRKVGAVPISENSKIYLEYSRDIINE